MFRLRPFLFLKVIFLARGVCSYTHAVWRTKLCSAVKRKCEWERFWDVDKEEGREIGGVFNFAVSKPPYNSARPPITGRGEWRGEREWSALRFGWASRGLWQPAAGLSPMSSSSSLNYEGSGMAASLITMTDCPSFGISQTVIVACVGYEGKEEAHFSLVFPFLSLHENSQKLKSDWLERREMFHDLARQNWWKARDRWCCTDGAL